MEYDLFISYSTIDNRDGRIARLVEELQRVLDFVFGIRPRVYFDTEEDEENDALSDRRERESEALHESAILLACLSPSYLESERCRRQLETFRELAAKQNRLTDILAVDINDVSRWMDPVPDDECCFFISQIRQRQVFDLRLWYSRDDSPRTDLLDLIQEIVERLPGGKATTDFLTAPYDRSSAVLGSEEARSEFVIDSSPSASRRECETVPYASVDQTVSEHQPPDNERATRTSAQEEITDRQSDDVVFTVYRRRTVLPGKWYPLLAFAHLSARPPDAAPDEPDPTAEVQRQARTLLGGNLDQYKQSSEESSSAIPQAGELSFKPHVPGVEFNPESRTFRWEESVHREEFKMRATQSLDGKVAKGCLRVYLGPLVVAQIGLSFKVDSKAPQSEIGPQAVEHARPLRKVFASYSHKDHAIVERIEKIVTEAHLGIEYLRDATKLRAGEVWNERLMQMIDEADMFQLFWSTNSMRSKYVKQEYEYALGSPQSDFILPVYWEKPFPEDPQQGLPPEALRRLHFEKLTPAKLSDDVTMDFSSQPLPESSEPVDTIGAPQPQSTEPNWRDAPTGKLEPWDEIMSVGRQVGDEQPTDTVSARPPAMNYPAAVREQEYAAPANYRTGTISFGPRAQSKTTARKSGALIAVGVISMLLPTLLAPFSLFAYISVASSNGENVFWLLLVVLLGSALLFLVGAVILIKQMRR